MFYARPTTPPLVFHTAGECTACGGTGIIPPPDVCECDWSGCGCIAYPCAQCGRDATMWRLHALRLDVGAGVALTRHGMLARLNDIIAARDLEDS